MLPYDDPLCPPVNRQRVVLQAGRFSFSVDEYLFSGDDDDDDDYDAPPFLYPSKECPC